MVPTHIQAFLRGVDAINRLDAGTVLALTDEECVFEPLRSQTEGAFVGHDGMRRFLADTAETFDLFKVSYTDLRDLGGERLLAIGTIRIRGSESGVESDVISAAVVELRDGRMLRYRDYGDAQLALQAADVPG
ncbi:MAG TPA: nuclear transport factor 2 family protein [Thermoleophilaceae bacterium]|nr:nuclear transport factor 2 family protein [Thermoleophilaceae bacterium]